MKPARLLVPLLFLFSTACGVVNDWREIKTAPMTIGECYDGLIFIADKDGFSPDMTECDRGLGTWQSRWRMRQIGLGRPGRYRLKAEILVDEGSAKDGWTIRYVVEQQKVKDLRRSLEPSDTDWSNDGQDRERESILGEKLVRRLGAKVM